MKLFKRLNVLILLILAATFLVACEKEEPPSPVELDTALTDALRLDTSFSGKNFINDGIGEVRLNRCVDGDTISVYVGSQSITIRFLGIDTPESTGVIEAWGKAASAYVRNILESADSIVLEAEDERIDSTGKRYLAWVWYRPNANAEYRLLNLEEVEMAYSKYKIVISSKYNDIFLQAHNKVRETKKKVWGEKDPNFNYSKDIIETTILHMLDHHDDYQTGTKFLVTVRLVRTAGNNMFLEDAYDVSYDEEGEIIEGKGGIYAFGAYKIGFYNYYKIGDVFTLKCQLEYEGNFGTQLTGLDDPSAIIENSPPLLAEFSADHFTGGASLKEHYGKVIKVTDLIVTAIKAKQTASGDDYHVVECVNSRGEKIDVYFGNNLMHGYDVGAIFEVGGVYDIIAGVAYYEFANGFYQLSMGDGPRYDQGVLNPEDEIRLNDIVKVN